MNGRVPNLKARAGACRGVLQHRLAVTELPAGNAGNHPGGLLRTGATRRWPVTSWWWTSRLGRSTGYIELHDDVIHLQDSQVCNKTRKFVPLP